MREPKTEQEFSECRPASAEQRQGSAQPNSRHKRSTDGSCPERASSRNIARDYSVIDDFSAELPVTLAGLEAIERFVAELGAFLDTPTASSRVALPDTNHSAACSSPSQETADQS